MRNLFRTSTVSAGVLAWKGVKIGISSHKDFVEKTLPVCVESLVRAGFWRRNIYLFIGGYDGDYQKTDVGHGIHAYKCPHNSFDFTSLVSIIELGLKREHWFLVHDTIEFDADFCQILRSELREHSKKLSVPPSMSMGCYTPQAIASAAAELPRIKNLSKADCVELEDHFIRDLPPICDGFEDGGARDVYGTGVTRFIEHYKAGGIKKFKANNQRRDEYITDV